MVGQPNRLSTSHSATHRGMVVARLDRFASATSGEASVGFPSSSTRPFPVMLRAATPADSPAQSPYPTLTCAVPDGNSVGICLTTLTGLISLHLRWGLSVARSTLRRGRYLAQRK